MMNTPFLVKDFHKTMLRKAGGLRPETQDTDSLLQACSQRHYVDIYIMLCLWCLWPPGWICV